MIGNIPTCGVDDGFFESSFKVDEWRGEKVGETRSGEEGCVVPYFVFVGCICNVERYPEEGRVWKLKNVIVDEICRRHGNKTEVRGWERRVLIECIGDRIDGEIVS
jgi:hypothetical protein